MHINSPEWLTSHLYEAFPGLEGIDNIVKEAQENAEWVNNTPDAKVYIADGGWANAALVLALDFESAVDVAESTFNQKLIVQETTVDDFYQNYYFYVQCAVVRAW